MNNPPHTYIFVSIPRNASTTVQAMLGLREPKEMSFLSDPGILDMHAPAEMALRRYGKEEFDRRFKFCFVRNPWDRCVSWYCYHSNIPPYKQYTFADWIKAGMPHHWDIQNGTVYQRRRTPLDQFRFISDDSGNQLMDHVGRIERFDQDMAVVAERLGMEFPAKLPRANAAKARKTADYREYYDDQTAEQVGKMLATDVQMFGYSF